MMRDASAPGQASGLGYRGGTVEPAKRPSKAEWLLAHRRHLLLPPLAVGFLAIIVAVVWPASAMAMALVAMTVAAIIGLVLSASRAAEVLLALRERRVDDHETLGFLARERKKTLPCPLVELERFSAGHIELRSGACQPGFRRDV